ncbi:MAG TPA: HAD hydrolase-like protein [Mycobacteriales bacterium]|nr:HAD hydrolase-like protein [Mycobacteriales bacterium]
MRFVLFDLDDTLIATLEASFAAWAAAAGPAAPDRAEFVAGYRSLTFPECVARWLGPVDVEEFAAAYRAAVVYRPIGDVPGLVAALRERGIGAGIVTNSTGPEAARKLAAAGIDAGAFAFVVGRPEDGSRMPVKDLGRILGDRGVDPATAVHLSDNPVDLAPSVAAGLPFRGVLTGAWARADFTAAGLDPADVHADVHAATWDLR